MANDSAFWSSHNFRLYSLLYDCKIKFNIITVTLNDVQFHLSISRAVNILFHVRDCFFFCSLLWDNVLADAKFHQNVTY